MVRRKKLKTVEGVGGDKKKVAEKNEKKEEVDAIAEKCVIYECGKEKGK